MRALERAVLLLLVWGDILNAQRLEHQRMDHPPLRASGSQLIDKALSDSARLEWVKHLSTNGSSSSDFATDVAVDDAGFVYVTGASESPDAGRDILTIKYNPLGQEVWRARYDGPAHADDFPSALVVDKSGNVYVTGASTEVIRSYPNYQLVTVKYGSSGQEEWAARYNDPSNEGGNGTAITLDAAGNVYVTGESDRWDTTHIGQYWNSGMVTIKYSLAGVQQWLARYNGERDIQRSSTAIVVDRWGHAFVAGGSIPFLGLADFVVIRYGADGTEQWASRTTDSSSTGKVVGLVADDSGGVYAAWYAAGSGWGPECNTSITKFNQSGQAQWSRTYEGPAGLNYLGTCFTADQEGNLFVTGTAGVDFLFSGAGEFIFTLKCDPSGNLLWSRTYTDLRNRPHITFTVSDIVVDHTGNVYVIGSGGKSYQYPPYSTDYLVTIKYDVGGTEQWARLCQEPAASKSLASAGTCDGSGNLFVVGGTGSTEQSDFVTLKFQPSGKTEWEARATGVGSSFESVSAMTVDNAGNVYLTGSSIGAGTSSDFLTVKLDPQGNTLWSARYNSPDSGYDSPDAIVVDGVGQVYVTGSSHRSNADTGAYTTVKYADDGSQLWVAKHNAGGGSWYCPVVPLPTHLAVDALGNVYVGGGPDLVKYDPEGHETWSDPGCVYALTIDRHNSLYFSTDSAIIRIDSAGMRQTLIQAPAEDIAVDDSENIFVTRLSWYPWEAQTQKYSASGNLMWSQNRCGDEMRLDQSGNLYVKRTIHWVDTLFFSIGPSGNMRWAARHAPFDYGLVSLAVDHDENSFLCLTDLSSGEPAFKTIKYNQLGIQEWSACYNDPRNTAESPEAIAVDRTGNVYVAGTTQKEDFSTVMTLVKYSQVTVGVQDEPSGEPESFSLSQNYPNPFNPRTEIRFHLPALSVQSGQAGVAGFSRVTLKIYDVLGREVSTLVNDNKKPGTYTVAFDGTNLASGVYFYRLEAGSFIDTKKLMLIK